MKYQNRIFNRLKRLSAFILLNLFSISAIYAADANFLYKEDDISVIRFTGDYDVDIPNGVSNSEARIAVSNAFYANNDDAYDFLLVFTQFDVEMGQNVQGFFSNVKNDIGGIGIPIFAMQKEA